MRQKYTNAKTKNVNPTNPTTDKDSFMVILTPTLRPDKKEKPDVKNLTTKF